MSAFHRCALGLICLVVFACGSVPGNDPDAGTGEDASNAVTVTNVTSPLADGAYTSPAVIEISVTFSAPVTVTGTPQLTLNSGAPAVDYSGGSGTDTLAFSYTVADGEESGDLDYVEPRRSRSTVARSTVTAWRPTAHCPRRGVRARWGTTRRSSSMPSPRSSTA